MAEDNAVQAGGGPVIVAVPAPLLGQLETEAALLVAIRSTAELAAVEDQSIEAVTWADAARQLAQALALVRGRRPRGRADRG